MLLYIIGLSARHYGRKRMGKNKVIVVHNINITISDGNLEDYICITDIAKAKVASPGDQML